MTRCARRRVTEYPSRNIKSEPIRNVYVGVARFGYDWIRFCDSRSRRSRLSVPIALEGKCNSHVKSHLFGRTESGTDSLLAGTHQRLPFCSGHSDIEASSTGLVSLLASKLDSQRVLICYSFSLCSKSLQVD